MRFSRLLACAVALVSQSVFAAGDEAKIDTCTQKHSFAYCAMDLIGRSVGVADLPLSSVPGLPSLEGKASNSTDWIQAGIGGAVFLEGSVLGHVFGAALVIDALLKPSNLSESVNMFIVMPRSIAGKDDPQEFAIRIYVDAIQKMLGTTKVQRADESFLLFLGGDFCGDIGCLVGSSLFNRTEEFRRIATKQLDPAPAWLGMDEPVFVWIDAAPAFQQINGKKFKPTPISAEAAARLAKELPDWFYTYIPSHIKKTPSVLLNGENVRYTVLDK